MKELLKKLLALFKTPSANKPVELVVPDFLKVVEPAKQPAKKKPGRPKKTGVLAVKQPAKKTQVKKKVTKKAK